MATYTPGVGIQLLEARQTQPHLVVNEGFNNVDKLVSRRYALDLSAAGASYTLNNSESTFFIINPFSATVDFDLIMNGVVKAYIIINDTAHTCSFGHSAGVKLSISAGETVHCYFDGTNMKGLSSTDSLIVDSGWVAPTLGTSWANFGGWWTTAEYRKIGNEVTLKGHVSATAGDVNQDIFSLPSGYRPQRNMTFNCIDAGVNRRVNIYDTGEVKFMDGVAVIGELCLDGVRFFTD